MLVRVEALFPIFMKVDVRGPSVFWAFFAQNTEGPLFKKLKAVFPSREYGFCYFKRNIKVYNFNFQ
jgi:hypothetical protein